MGCNNNKSFKRAKETAEVINKDLDLALIKMNEFLERFFGDSEGIAVEESLEAFPTIKYPNQEGGCLK